MIPKSGYPGQCFSNNWISFHENGMRHCIQCSQPTAVQASGGNFGYVRGKGFKTENIVDYTSAEEDGFRKEGSLLLEQMKAYCALSPR
jgi:hypothetical protein